MEAELRGKQQKVVATTIAPLRMSVGNTGIPVKDGRTLPFRISRRWSAPAGHYIERWYLVDPKTREVLFEGPALETLLWGLQSLTELSNDVTDPIPLEPGTYLIVYSLDGLLGGEFEVDAVEVDAEAA
jgi:hypothetical protein